MDYYELLGLKRNSSRAELCQAYKRRALEVHPQLPANKNSKAQLKIFHNISEAFEVLYDDQKRAVYDVHGYDGLQYGVGKHFGGYCYLGNALEIFEEFFGTDNVYSAALASEEDMKQIFDKSKFLISEAPENLKVEIELNLEEVMDGCTKNIQYNLDVLTEDFMSVKTSTRKKEIRFERGQSLDKILVFKMEGNTRPGHSVCKIIYSNIFTIWKIKYSKNEMKMTRAES